MEKEIEIIKSLINDLKREEKLIGYDAEVEIKAIETLIEEFKKIKKENEHMNVRIKTKLRIAQGNYERYEKDGEYRLALIQCGKVGTLQELLEGE